MGTKRTFTEGKIFSPLISFAFPVLIALFLQAMYGAVDLWVVGKFGSAADVSAVATGGQDLYCYRRDRGAFYENHRFNRPKNR